MRMTERLDHYQRRHPWAGYPIAVIYKFFDDQGAYLAALITFYGFLSLFPLLLLLSSILGFVLQTSPHLQRVVLDSALSQFPIIGDELRDPKGLQGSGIAVVIGAVTAVYGALGVAQATTEPTSQPAQGTTA
jgi:membrane protein